MVQQLRSVVELVLCAPRHNWLPRTATNSLAATMKKASVPLLFLLAFWGLLGGNSFAQRHQIPDALKPWQQWATWDLVSPNCPPAYNDAQTRICCWPSRLELRATAQGANWEIEVQCFDESWMPLPGAGDMWPQNVHLDGDPAVVVPRDGVPAVKLSPGQHKLDGSFLWDGMPQSMAIPAEIGLIALELAGQAVPMPAWDQSGRLWLQR
jgi:hypothetical protein